MMWVLNQDMSVLVFTDKIKIDGNNIIANTSEGWEIIAAYKDEEETEYSFMKLVNQLAKKETVFCSLSSRNGDEK